MIRATTKASMQKLIYTLEQVLKDSLLDNLNPVEQANVLHHLEAMRLEASYAGAQIISTCALQTFPERKATMVTWELAFTTPVMDSGKRSEQ